MLVSLTIRPVSVNSEFTELHLTVGETQGYWTFTPGCLTDAMRLCTPITVRLQTPEAPMPNHKRIKRATIKQETKVAEDLGGHRQRGSGAVPWRKGDGRVDGKYRIENKTCLIKGIRVERADLTKIRSECSPGEVPLFQIDFTNRQTLRVEDQWVLVPFEHWKAVVGAASDDQ